VISGKPHQAALEGLLRRKYSDTDIEQILGGNSRRALAEIWKWSEG